MVISLSRIARQKIIKTMDKCNTNKILFSLKSGGCNGFEYKLEPIKSSDNISKIDEKMKIDKEKDIYICGKSLMYLLGTKIDWEDDVMGSRFIFNNPLSKNSCGCGSSFNPNLN